MFLSRIPVAFSNAFLSPGFRHFGARFAFDYLRFAARCARAWGHTGPGRLHLLGNEIEYPNQSHALFLVHEIFVQCAYAFSASRQAPRIIDCGANVGFSVLFFKALYPQARILAFEPEPMTFGWLQKNIAVIAADVELRQAAVAEHAGVVALTTQPQDAGSMLASIHTDWAAGHTVDVPAVRLSDVITDTIDLLKLDVEGAEYGVLRDLAASEAIRRVRRLVVEYHHVAAEPGGAPGLTGLLTATGMRVSVQPADDGRSGLVVAEWPSP